MLKIQMIGRVGNDATVNQVNGKSVVNFSLAHTEKFKNAQGETKSKTTWVDCAYWSDKTSIAQYIKKGGQVYVEGSPEVRSYVKNDGTTATTQVIRVSKIELLSTTQAPSNQSNDQAPNAQDDLPF